MKLDNAIEIVIKLERTLAPTMSADGTDAILLLIQAGRRIQRNRLIGNHADQKKLPGES